MVLNSVEFKWFRDVILRIFGKNLSDTIFLRQWKQILSCVLFLHKLVNFMNPSTRTFLIAERVHFCVIRTDSLAFSLLSVTFLFHSSADCPQQQTWRHHPGLICWHSSSSSDIFTEFTSNIFLSQRRQSLWDSFYFTIL